MTTTAHPHTKLTQHDFRKIYPKVWRRNCFYGAVYPPGPLGKAQVDGGCGFIFSLVEFAVNERCFLKCFAFLLFQVQSASCVAAGRTLVVLLVVGLEFITEGDFAGRVPVALAVVRIWN
jgi:hypothetical protein